MKCPHCKGTGELHASDIGFGALLKARREALGLTQADLAMAVGISRTQVTNLEAGRTDIPLKSLRLYANALNCEPGDLVS